jgi:hypothetical protein
MSAEGFGEGVHLRQSRIGSMDRTIGTMMSGQEVDRWSPESSFWPEPPAIAATSIFNGMFAELLAGRAPYILFKLKRVVCWGDPDQPMDFTTKDDPAAFTAAAALDPASPRFLRIAGDQRSARELADIASEVAGERFRLLRAGGLGTLRALVRITRSLLPRPDELYPPWQGMQYMANMFSGRAKLAPLDNDRYPRHTLDIGARGPRRSPFGLMSPAPSSRIPTSQPPPHLVDRDGRGVISGRAVQKMTHGIGPTRRLVAPSTVGAAARCIRRDRLASAPISAHIVSMMDFHFRMTILPICRTPPASSLRK